MTELMSSILGDLRDAEFKRGLLNEEIEKLSPELKVELELRKFKLIHAMNQRWELPKQSQPLYKNITRMMETRFRPFWTAAALGAVFWIEAQFMNREYKVLEFSLIFAGAAAIFYFHSRFDLLEMNQRFRYLSENIEQAQLTLNMYGYGFLDSYGAWRTANEDFPVEMEGYREARLLREAVFFIELEEGILINMKRIGFLDLTLNYHGLK